MTTNETPDLPAMEAEAVTDLRSHILSRIAVFRDMEPEEDETWESWYFAAFDLLALEMVALASPPKPDKGVVEALREASEAIAEYVRYLDGGEMRGSYDGKPERNALRKAGIVARNALAGDQP